MAAAGLLPTLYAALLRLFPRCYRKRYSAEMLWVFVQAYGAARGRGPRAAFLFLFREFFDLPGELLAAHWHVRRLTMKAPPVYPGWYFLAVLIPFLVPMLIVLQISLQNLPLPAQYGLMLLLWAIALTLPAACIVGLLRGLPVWSLPALGVGFFILNFFLVFNRGIESLLDFFHLRAWPDALPAQIITILQRNFVFFIPSILMIIFFLLILAVFPRTRPLLIRFRRDWSLLSFLMYGLPVVPFVMNDPYRHLGAFEAASLLILAGGAWFFLRIRLPWTRLGVLVVALTFATLLYSSGIYIAYPQEEWIGFTSFTREWEAIQPLLALPAALFVLCAPAVLSLFPPGWDFPQPIQPLPAS